MGKRTNNQAGVESESTVTSNSQNKPRGFYYWGKFCENRCLCNRTLSLQQVGQILSDLIFLQHVAAIKFCCRDKDFHQISPVHTKRLVAATCCRDMLLQVCTEYSRYDLQL